MVRGKLIVGLGNPGSRYRDTRHNLGAMVVEQYAKLLSLQFKKNLLLRSQLATSNVGECKIYLLLPMTYMNLSGYAVKKALDEFGLGLEDLIVIVDDIDLPFGKVRFRQKGSSGGHNGLKDIVRALGSQDFCRLRMGIDAPERQRMPLEEFVLDPFTSEERDQMAPFVQKGVELMAGWIEGGSAKVKEISEGKNSSQE